MPVEVDRHPPEPAHGPVAARLEQGARAGVRRGDPGADPLDLAGAALEHVEEVGAEPAPRVAGTDVDVDDRLQVAAAEEIAVAGDAAAAAADEDGVRILIANREMFARGLDSKMARFLSARVLFLDPRERAFL